MLFLWFFFCGFILLPSVEQPSKVTVEPSKKVMVQSYENKPSLADQIEQFCSEWVTEAERLQWPELSDKEMCLKIDWKIKGQSVSHRPLVYTQIGSDQAENITLIFASVHGDEITPSYMGMQLIYWLEHQKKDLKNTAVVVAPLVNPDGFFAVPKKRVNARGVDLNRNFHTKDWQKNALDVWKKKFHAHPRRFPGSTPCSEPETLFQEVLIKKFKPQKIISIHSPLNFLDYDGPGRIALEQFPKQYVQRCELLKKKLKATSTGFFTGSLGHYAGKEMGIPTVTLELPSAHARFAKAYWEKFQPGIDTVIRFIMPALGHML